MLDQHYSEIVRELENRFGLTFVDTSVTDSNLCYVASEELRVEFKQTLTANDIKNYVTGFLDSKNNAPHDREFTKEDFPYPADVATFWKLAARGKAGLLKG